MTLRTPRRHISPRTKRRYRVIKNFLRRALGSSSQRDTQYDSSLSVSVSDLKQKIEGIEEQLNTVSKHCQNLAFFEYNLRSNTVSLPKFRSETPKVQNNEDSAKDCNEKIIKEPEAKVLNQTSHDHCCKLNLPCASTSSNSDGRARLYQNKNNDEKYSYNYHEKERRKRYKKLHPIQECKQPPRSQKIYPFLEDFPNTCPKKDFHSCTVAPLIRDNNPNNEYFEVRSSRKRNKKEISEIHERLVRDSNLKFSKPKRENHKSTNNRNKCVPTGLDPEFISDIIKRQYRPVTLFGRRDSDFSQFSAPVCRDQDFPFCETSHEESDLCSCCYKDRNNSRYISNKNISDIRSICDTRLYSTRKHKRHTKYMKRFEDYNDSAVYDIIPVKEKCSPKSRRKFVEENMLLYDKYKEVPPSPRSQRPRLNLQAQFNIENDDEPLEQHVRHRRQWKLPMGNNDNASSVSSQVFIHSNLKGATRKLQDRKSTNQDGFETSIINKKDIINNNTTLNTQATDISADKTDKTLCEIKDILQNFLIELKKESSQNDKFDSTPQSNIQKIAETQQQMNRNSVSNQGQSFNTNNIFRHQCPHVPPFIQPTISPRCYPILPVCAMNCMPSGFVLPNQSCTCASCDNKSKEPICRTNDSLNKTKCSEVTNNETQKLIKEIHNLVSQNPNSVQKEFFNINNSTGTKKETNHISTKTFISKDVGGSSEASKDDAKVGTPKMKSYSRSCEALGSQIDSDRPCIANVCYSDTVLEKGSGEAETAAQSSSELDYTSESTVVYKKKGNRFTRLLKSIGLMKRNKKQIMQEISESNSSLKVEKRKPRPPFQHCIMNYNMHGQESFYPPPVPTYPHQCEYYVHPSHYSCSSCYSPTYFYNKLHNSHSKQPQSKEIRSRCASSHYIPISAYPNYYEAHCGNVSPQVALCFKEIEVKSIGTQSVKMSLLERFTNKMRQQKEPSTKHRSMLTSKDKPATNLFDWKKLQSKAMHNTQDPLKFSYKAEKRLAEKDVKMRNAMLRKLFFKRNPFSPRNLLVRTLLGKDRSTFSELPKMYKPKMFL